MTRFNFPHLRGPATPLELLRPATRAVAWIAGTLLGGSLLLYVANKSPMLLELLGRTP